MAKRDHLNKGDQCGYAVIVCRQGAYTNMENTMYIIKKSCCGQHDEMSHKNLLAIRHKVRIRCRACEAKRRAGEPRKGKVWSPAEDAIIHKLWPTTDRDLRLALLEAGYERTMWAIQQHRIGTLGLGDEDDGQPAKPPAFNIVPAAVIQTPDPKNGRFAIGHWWPSLGPMGPRHGTTGRY